MAVYLVWRWNDSAEHTERRAAYKSLDDAKAQADHDLARAEQEDDYSTAPLRIEDETGEVLWSADPAAES